MNTSVEISYYPLKQEDYTPIEDFIKRLHNYHEITVKTNGMSTQVFGDYTVVMQILTKEIEKSMKIPHSVFVMKIINAHLDIQYD